MLSIVIPAYNEEEYIGNCIESIVKESERSGCEVKIIIVNNGSTDRTREIAIKYSGVTVIDEPRRGLGWARQAGYKVSNHELIANIDADTNMPAGWIDTVKIAFDKDKKLVALSGPCIYMDLPIFHRKVVFVFYTIGLIISKIHHLILGRGAILQGGNFVVKKSALDRTGGFDTKITFYGEDTAIAQRLEAIGKVKFSFRLTMKTDARRFRSEGLLKTGLRYAMNYLWVTYFKKPFSKNSTHDFEVKNQ